MEAALPSRSELRKEQERERRRLRDRQRRQSMSLEEREKHLARRRRNYQIRRQRAQNSGSASTPTPQIEFHQSSIIATASVEDGGGGVLPLLTLPSNQELLEASVSDVSAPDPSGSDQLGENSIVAVAEITNPQCLEIPAEKLAIIPGKLRLNRLKHLARMMNSCNGIAQDENGNATPNCKSVKGLRLNRIKRLARAIQAPERESVVEEHQNIGEG